MPTTTVYRATFPKTFKEIAAGTGHYRIVIPVVAANLVVGYFLAGFLRNSGEFRAGFLRHLPEWAQGVVWKS